MTKRKRKKQSSSFVQQKKLLLVKILFEEVSFEGREERAVTESKRKRIPDLDSREAKGTTRPPCCFLLKKGMHMVLSSKEERRDLEGT